MKYLLIFVLIFGPKFGFFDTRLILFPLLLFFDFSINKIISIVLCLLIYLLFKDIVLFQELHFNELLRLLRLIYAVILIDIFSKNFGYSLKDIGIVLLIHVFFVILMNEFESIRNVIHSIYGFTKSTKEFRSTGLTIGYDISGFISIISFIIWRKIKIRNYYKNIILCFIFLAVLLSSRVSMFVMVILLFLYSKKIMLNNKMISLFLILIFIFFSRNYIYELYNQIKIFFGFIESDVESFGGYAVYSIESLIDQIFIWPTDIVGWLFGFTDEKVDSGYSMIIMEYGLIGLVIILSFYKKLFKMDKTHNIIFSSILILMFILNIKNEYFLTRGITEILLLLAFINGKNEKKENNFLTTV